MTRLQRSRVTLEGPEEKALSLDSRFMCTPSRACAMGSHQTFEFW
jgi:hypothetical protein